MERKHKKMNINRWNDDFIGWRRRAHVWRAARTLTYLREILKSVEYSACSDNSINNNTIFFWDGSSSTVRISFDTFELGCLSADRRMSFNRLLLLVLAVVQNQNEIENTLINIGREISCKVYNVNTML